MALSRGTYSTKKHPKNLLAKYNTPEELQLKIDDYFKMCEEKKKPLTVSGLAVWIGLSRAELIAYQKSDDFNEILKKAKNMCESFLEQQLHNSGQVAGLIFILKNCYGWRDRQEFTGQDGMPIEVSITSFKNLKKT